MAGEAKKDDELDDSAMLSELKVWMETARQAIPGHPKLRHVDTELWKINAIAEQLKGRAMERLSGLQDRYNPDLQMKLVAGSSTAAFSKANARLDAYRREREAVVAEFSERNDKLWRQRMVLTRDLMAVVERQEMKGFAPAGQQRSLAAGADRGNVSGSFMDRLRDRASERAREQASEMEQRPVPDVEMEP